MFSNYLGILDGMFFASQFTGIKSLNSLMSFGQMSLQGVIWYGLMMKLVSLLGKRLKRLEFPLFGKDSARGPLSVSQVKAPHSEMKLPES